MSDKENALGLVRGWSNLTVYGLIAQAGPHHATNALGVLVFVDWLHWDLGIAGRDLTPSANPSWLSPTQVLIKTID
jgi:hypothetical protein